MFDQGKTLGPPLGSTGLAVPTHMFKVVIDYSRMEAIAFVIPNKPIFPEGLNENSRGSLRQWEQEISKYSVSIRDIENWSGLRFNTALSAPDREKLNTQKSAMWPTKAAKSKKSGKKNKSAP
jgi:DNA/RNA endonuclease G (NUC1)